MASKVSKEVRRFNTNRLADIFSLLFLATLILCGCSSEPDPTPSDNPKLVDIDISLSSSSSHSPSRDSGSTSWDDANAVEGEMMRNCFVVIVQGGKIKGVISKSFAEETNWVGFLTTKIEPGATTFYSFANISPTYLGIDASIDYSSTDVSLPADFDSKLFTVNGNKQNINDFTHGIPMSNKQTITVAADKQKVELEVIRMVAKMKLMISNVTPNPITLNSISLSDITKNEANNLHLLPGKDNGTSVETNVNPSASKEDYTITFTTPLVVADNNTTPVEVSFYLNESVASTPKNFVITLHTNNATISQRGALSNWNTISRNDYLVIPIRLNDYRITFDVEQFTAIGVLPSIKQDKDKFTVKFKSYGEFHLVPHVIRISDNKELTLGSTAGNGWTFNKWETIEMKPKGNAGTCIYDRIPEYVPSKNKIEGVMSNRTGYAIHQFKVSISINGANVDIPYKIEIIKE